jgi:hypothetical protein
MRYIKSLLDWIGRWQVFQSLWPIFTSILLPIATALTAVGAGYVQRVPVMWIIMASSLTFMAIIVAMFFVSSFTDMRTPAHKLRYISTVVAVDLAMPPNRKSKRASTSTTTLGIVQSYLDKVQVGVQLQNVAAFPISAHIVSATTKMSGKEPPRTEYPKPSVTISPGNVVNMTDVPIEMHSLPCGKMEGVLDMKIKYGRKGRENFELLFKAKLEIFMRKDGLIQFISTAWEANQPGVINSQD